MIFLSICRGKLRATGGAKKRIIKRFKILTPIEHESETPNPSECIEEAAEEDEEPPEAPPLQTRWVLGPKQSQELTVEFSSEDIGRFQENLTFEISSPGAPARSTSASLTVSGICDYPQISSDYRDVYYRKARTRPRSPLVSRQFIIPLEKFEFGPLLAGKSSEEYKSGLYPENCAKFRIMNNGLFKLHVDFDLKSAAEKPAPVKGGKGEQIQPPFFLEPQSMDLTVGQTLDLLVYAYPMEVGEFEETVVCTVDGNPSPVEFPLTCVGCKPLMEMRSQEPPEEGQQDQVLKSRVAVQTHFSQILDDFLRHSLCYTGALQILSALLHADLY